MCGNNCFTKLMYTLHFFTFYTLGRFDIYFSIRNRIINLMTVNDI